MRTAICITAAALAGALAALFWFGAKKPAEVTEISSNIRSPSTATATVMTASNGIVTAAPSLLAFDKMSNGERLSMLEAIWDEGAPRPQQEQAGELIRAWAREMPQAAAEWLAQRPDGPMRREASRSVAILWANENLSAAADWVRRWPASEQESGLIAVAYEAARRSPADALRLVSEMDQTPKRDELISHAVREWAVADPSAPLQWAAQMPEHPLREQVYASAAVALSDKEPEQAAALALEKVSSGPLQEQTVASVVQRWVQKEPAAAADWVLRFPEGLLRDQAVENVVQLWAGRDAAATAEWLNQIEPGAAKDLAVAKYARIVAEGDPHAAVIWTESIGAPSLRQKELESLTAFWLEKDKKAAQAWLETVPLTQDLQGQRQATNQP